MADDPPFVFRDTSEDDAREYVAKQRRFRGYGTDEIARAEASQGFRFPPLFREYLETLGRERGELFCGSDVVAIDAMGEARAHAKEIAGNDLPASAVVLLTHQGYSVVYVLDDDSVWQVIEGETPKRVAASIRDFIAAEVSLMEDVWRSQHEDGGYYVSISRGIVSMTFPAAGERPFEKRWWQIFNKRRRC